MPLREPIAVFALFGALGCRQILGVDDLTYDLSPADGGGGAGAEAGAPSTTTTGGGGIGGFGGAGGEMPLPCAAAERAATADGVLFWSTLDDAAAIESPAAGSGPGELIGGDIVPAPSNAGLLLDEPGEMASWPVALEVPTNLLLRRGALDLCLRPRVDHDSTEVMPIFAAGGGDDVLSVVKSEEGQLVVAWTFVPNSGAFFVPVASYALTAGEWYRLTVTWQFEAEPKVVTIALDGVLLPGGLEGQYPDGVPANVEMGALGVGAELQPGPGTLDEVVVYDAPFEIEDATGAR
jgi:hypothetical protein